MSIPAPEPGLVISYSYLWRDEREAGYEEGKKDRPAVVVLCVEQDDDGAVLVTVIPVTRRPPQVPDSAIEVPASIKRHLGLDDDPSWAVITEVNEFIWPGYDLRRVPDAGTYHYGALPPRFLAKIKGAMESWRRAGKIRAVPRD